MTMTIDNNTTSEQDCHYKICSLAETIRKMRERESDYVVSDYLHQKSILAYKDPVDMTCRSQMIDWIINIIEHCKFSKVTASIAINYLDRFLMKSEWALIDRSAFQLAFITCLYIAIKVHEPTVLSVESIESLIRNVYTKHQIEQMEIIVLTTIQWRMNPSTSFHFATYLCDFISLMDSRLHLETLKELITLQLESTLCDYEVGLLPASLVALAAVMNAVDSMEICSKDNLQEMEVTLQSILECDSTYPLYDIRIRLYESIIGEQQGVNKWMEQHSMDCSCTAQLSCSPRSVSKVRVTLP